MTYILGLLGTKDKNTSEPTISDLEVSNDLNFLSDNGMPIINKSNNFGVAIRELSPEEFISYWKRSTNENNAMC